MLDKKATLEGKTTTRKLLLSSLAEALAQYATGGVAFLQSVSGVILWNRPPGEAEQFWKAEATKRSKWATQVLRLPSGETETLADESFQEQNIGGYEFLGLSDLFLRLHNTKYDVFTWVMLD